MTPPATPRPSSRSPRTGRRVRLFPGVDPDAVALTDVLRSETVGGALMLLAAVAAVVWATVDPAGYAGVQHAVVGPMSLAHWASDGLLAIFFFLAGLELKREFTTGSLARPADALVPVAAAVAGMAVPAGIYLAVNLLAPAGLPSGWAIPMATDIAFALAVLAVAAPRLPATLRVFLLTLAVVDDLGAVLIIAVVFTAHVHVGWLVGALACAAIWFALQRRRIDVGWLYLPLFLACWWCMYASGVHATVAGVLLGLLTRSGRGEADAAPAPVNRWEHRWRPVSAAVAVPVFALLAAGVPLQAQLLIGLVTAPVSVGIIAGLVVGKALGVFLGAYAVARWTRARLSPGLSWRDIAAAGLLAGVGFTVALLLTELSLPTAEDAEQARAAVLAASVLAALLATALIRLQPRPRLRQGLGSM